MKNSSNQTNQLAGKLWLSAIGVILMLVGTVFIWYLWAVYQKACLMDTWVEVPCTIQKSGMDDSELTQHYGTKFTLVTDYVYQFEGTQYQGTLCKRIQPASGDPKKIEPYLEKYPVGSTICFVNPEKPTEAVLKKDSKAALYSAWFPALFVIGGIGIVLSTFIRRSQR